jgi:hypothetical protein
MIETLKKIFWLQKRYVQIFFSTGIYPPFIRNRKRAIWKKKDKT